MADSLAEDEARFAEFGRALAEAIDAELPGWIRRCVESRVALVTPGILTEIDQASTDARRTVTPVIAALLDRELQDQDRNPLDVLRDAITWPTEILQRAGAPAVSRDAFDEKHFPADVYGLSPASFADVSPALHEPGIVWGAAKAHVHLRRRREAS